MPQQDIPTLKGFFNAGDTPNESQFADLIDSFVHKSLYPADKIAELPEPEALEDRFLTIEQATIFELGSRVNAAAADAYLLSRGLTAQVGMRFFSTTTGTQWNYDTTGWEDSLIAISPETGASIVSKLAALPQADKLDISAIKKVATIEPPALVKPFAANGRYNAFGEFFNRNGSISYIHRSGTSHTAGGRIDLEDYDSDTNTFSAPRTILTDGTYDLRDATGGVLSNEKIIVFTSQYTGSAFVSIGYILSTDLTGTSWSAYISLNASLPAGVTAFLSFGALVASDIAGTYYQTAYGFNTGTSTYKLWLWKIVYAAGAVTISRIDVYSGAVQATESSMINGGGGFYYMLSRVNNRNQMVCFHTTSVEGAWSGPVDVPLGVSGSGGDLSACIPKLYKVGNLAYALYQDRIDGWLKTSVANIDVLKTLPASWASPIFYRFNKPVSDKLPLGYPGIIELPQRPGVYLTAWTEETTLNQANLRYRLNTISELTAGPTTSSSTTDTSGFAQKAASNTFTAQQIFNNGDAVGNPVIDFQKSNLTIPDYSALTFQPALNPGQGLRIGTSSSTTLGAIINGFTTSAAAANPLLLVGYHGSTAPTAAAILFRGRKHNGTTGAAALAGTEPLLEFQNNTTKLLSVTAGGRLELFGVGTTADERPSFRMYNNNITVADFSGMSVGYTTKTIANFADFSGTTGGAAFTGITTSAVGASALGFVGLQGSTAPTAANMVFIGRKHNGTTSFAALANTEIMAEFRNEATALLQLLGSGTQIVKVGATLATNPASGYLALTFNADRTITLKSSDGTSRTI